MMDTFSNVAHFVSHESSFYEKVDAAVVVAVVFAVVGVLMMTYLLCFVTVGVIAAFELLDDSYDSAHLKIDYLEVSIPRLSVHLEIDVTFLD